MKAAVQYVRVIFGVLKSIGGIKTCGHRKIAVDKTVSRIDVLSVQFKRLIQDDSENDWYNSESSLSR